MTIREEIEEIVLRNVSGDRMLDYLEYWGLIGELEEYVLFKLATRSRHGI
jgi:hypothetical protein